MRFIKIFFFSIFLNLIVGELIYGGELTGREIMQKVKDLEDGDNRKARLIMTLIEKNGYQRTRKMQHISKDYGLDTKSLFFFDFPQDLHGTSVLIYIYDESKGADNRQWLYLPALRKTKRLSTADKRGSFMGSDFTYADFEKLRLNDYSYQILGEERVDERVCYKIEANANDSTVIERTGYAKQLFWVDKDNFIILQILFFDSIGRELKKLEVNHVEKIEGYWTLLQREMLNLQTEHRTILQIDDIKYNTNISDIFFNQGSLEKGL